MKENQSPGTKTRKTASNMEFSPDLTPCAARLKEAGYGKDANFELADIGREETKEQAQKQALTEDQVYHARTHPENDVTRPVDDNALGRDIQRNFEFGTIIDQTGANPARDTGVTGFDAETAGETTGGAAENKAETHPNFEFGVINQKNNLPKPNK